MSPDRDDGLRSIVRGRTAGIGQLTNFVGHDGKTLSSHRGAGGFDRRVHGEKIRLRRDVLDHVDEIVDRGRELVEDLHLLRARLHELAQFEERVRGRGDILAVAGGQVVNPLAVVGNQPRAFDIPVGVIAQSAHRRPALLQ